MQSTVEFRDELCETNSELTIEWKLVDFFSLSEEEGCYYQSSVFCFARSSWNLLIFPKGDCRTQESGNYIALYLESCKLSEPPVEVTYTLGMKKANGTLKNSVEKKRSFTQDFTASGFQYFFLRSELLKRKEELLPMGDLIVTCTIKHDSVKVLEVATPEMKLCGLERLSVDFKDLFSSKKCCDTCIKVKNTEFQVHECILIARSPVFESMFKYDAPGKKTGTILVDDSDPETFGIFLNYLYTGKGENVTSANALNLYCTANKYKVHELKNLCVAYVMKHLTPENACDIFTFAEEYSETQLLSAVQIFINRKIVRIFSAVNWETLLSKNRRLANKLLTAMAKKAETSVPPTVQW